MSIRHEHRLIAYEKWVREVHTLYDELHKRVENHKEETLRRVMAFIDHMAVDVEQLESATLVPVPAVTLSIPPVFGNTYGPPHLSIKGGSTTDLVTLIANTGLKSNHRLQLRRGD